MIQSHTHTHTHSYCLGLSSLETLKDDDDDDDDDDYHNNDDDDNDDDDDGDDFADVTSSARSERNLAQENIPCPDDMTEYECYHTFMAVWTRLLHKDKRLSASNEAQQSLARRLSR